MNLEQKAIVNYWYTFLVLVSIILFIYLSAFENKKYLYVFIAGPIFIYLVSKDLSRLRGYGANEERLGEFLSNHSKLRLWLYICCVFILPFIIYKMFIAEGVPVALYFFAFSLIAIPTFITSEIDKFKAAGLKSPNKAFKTD